MAELGDTTQPTFRNPALDQNDNNEEFLQLGFELFNEQGFKGNLLDFERVINEDEDTLQFSYEIFVENGYEGTLDDYKTLMGIKNKPEPKEEIASGDQQLLLQFLKNPPVTSGTTQTTLEIPEPIELSVDEAKAREERDQEDIQQALKFAREKEDLTLGKSVGNDFSNFLLNLEGQDGRAKMFLDIAFQDDEDIMESARIVRENRSKMKPTFQATDIAENGIEAFGGAFFNALTGIGTSLVQGAQGAVVGGLTGLAAGAAFGGPVGAIGGLLTGGSLGFTAGFTSDMIATAVIENNIEKAKRLGITIEDLVKRGETDIFPGMTIGFLQGQLERFGLNKIFGPGIKAIPNKYKKAIADVAVTGGTNAFQELGQGFGDIVNRELGKQENKFGNLLDKDNLVEFAQGINPFSGENGKALLNQTVAGLLGGVGVRAPGLAINSMSSVQKAKDVLQKKYTKSEIARLVSSVQTRPEFERTLDILGDLSENKKNTATVETQSDMDAIEKDNKGLLSELDEIQNKAIVRAAKLTDQEISENVYPLYDKINDVTQTIEAIENSTFLSEEKKQNKIAEYTKQLEVLYRKQELNIESLNKRPNDLIEENFFIDGERVTKQQFDEYTLSQKGILQEEINEKGQPVRTYEKTTGSESSLKTTFYKTIGERGKKQYPTKPPKDIALQGFDVDEQNVEDGFVVTGIESIDETGDSIKAFAETKNEETNEVSGAVLLLTRKEGARLTQEQKEINEAAKILDGKNSEPLFKIEDSPSLDPNEQEIETMTEQLNRMDSDVINLDLPTDLTTRNSIDAQGIQDRFGSLPVLEQSDLRDFENIRVLFGMSDPLFTGTKTNPQTGNDLVYDGGALFNGKFQTLSWASTERSLEANEIPRGRAIYERDPVPYDILWDKRPDLYGHVVKAIVKMNDESVASNEAFFRVAIDNLSSLPKRNLRRAKNVLIDEIRSLRDKNVEGVGKKQITEKKKKEIVDFLKPKKDLIEVFENITDLALKDRAIITDRVFSGDISKDVKSVNMPDKSVAQELLRGQNPEKANLLHQRRIFEALNEDAISEIPSNHIISLVAVDIFTGETKEINHPNYKFGNKGKLIGLLKNPIHAADMFTEIRAKIPAMVKPDIKGKVPSLKTAITQAVDPRTAPTRIELQDAKITSKMDNMKELMGVLKLSFPDVTVFDTKYQFEKALYENNVRMYNKGGKDIYGFTTDNKIFINPEHMNEGVLLHEYGHVWQDFLRKQNNDLLNIGYDLIQRDKGFEEYRLIYGKKNADGSENIDLALDEYMADLISKRGQALLEASNRSRFVNWLNGVFTYIKQFFTKFTNMTSQQVQGMTMNEFIDGSISSMLSGRMNTKTEREQIQKVRFNKKSPADDIKTLLDYKGLGQNVIVRTIAAKHKLTGEQANALFKLISEEYQEEQLKLDGLKLGFQIKGKQIDLSKNKLIEGFKYLFSSRYKNPLSQQELQDSKHGRINRKLQDVIILLENIQKELKKQKDGVSDVRKILDGTIIPFIPDPTTMDPKLNEDLNISEELAQLAAEGRNRVDQLTKDLIKSGAIKNKEAINNVENNIGQYLNRTFRVFEEENYRKNLESQPDYQKLKAAAIKELQEYDVIKEEAGRVARASLRPYKEVRDELVERRFNQILDVAKQRYPTGATRGDKKAINILRERKEIPEAIKALMGEEKDPVVNLGNTLTKMTFLLEQQKYLNELRKAGMGVYFFNKNDYGRKRLENLTGEELVPIVQQKDSGLLNPLNGLYTYKYLADTINGVNNTSTVLQLINNIEGVPGSVLRWTYTNWRRAVGVTKVAKTILSPATHGVNVTGNMLFMAVNGYTDPKAYMKALNDVVAGYRSLSEQGKQQLYQTLQENNVIDQSVIANEVSSLFEKQRNLTDTHQYLQKGKDLVEKALKSPTGVFQKGKYYLSEGYKKAEKAYRAEDDFFKIVAFQMERDRQAKMDYNGLNFNQLNAQQKDLITKKAARIVKNILPNYSRLGNLNKFYKNIPLLATFISFTMESIRTSANTIGLAFDEAKRGNPKRLISIIVSQAAYQGIQALVGLDKDEEEEEEDRSMLPFWAINHQIKQLPQKERGVMRYIDFTQSDPHSYHKEILMAFMQGENTYDKFQNSFIAAVDPFIDKDIFTGNLAKVFTNTDTQGRSYIEDDEYSISDGIVTREAEIKFFNAFYKAFEPGIVPQSIQLYEAHINGTLASTIAGMGTGYKVRESDARDAVYFSSRDLSKKIRALNEGGEQLKKYYGIIRPDKIGRMTMERPTREQVIEAIADTRILRQKEYQKAFMLYKSALNQGLTHKEISKSMKGFFNQKIIGAFRKYQNYKILPTVPYQPKLK